MTGSTSPYTATRDGTMASADDLPRRQSDAGTRVRIEEVSGTGGCRPPSTDTATAVGGHHRDDELGDRRAVGCHDQQGFPEVPPGRTDRMTIVVERQHTRIR